MTVASPGGDGKGSLPYHKRWHSDMIAEVINLDLERARGLFHVSRFDVRPRRLSPRRRRFHAALSRLQLKGWYTLRDRLLHLQKIYRDGNRLLRSPLVDKELKSIRKMRDANSMAGMISQAKRQMTSKVVRQTPEVSNFAGRETTENIGVGAQHPFNHSRLNPDIRKREKTLLRRRRLRTAPSSLKGWASKASR